MRHEGQTLEDGGGFVITTDQWMVPTVPALEEVDRFDLKYFQTVYGQAFSFDPQPVAQLDALFPAFKTLAARAQAERGRVQGTAVSSTTTLDTVKSAEQLREEAQQQRQQQQQQQQQQLGGGDVGGMFGNRIGSRQTPVQQRTRTMTTTRDVLSIETTVTPADLAIPAGYKEKGIR
jgi:alkanesulfonate monooxygenase SsuD/methylene tetrahydromethanopterin reductase-like flavin-dependent oxidoreductase (luciferase family)